MMAKQTLVNDELRTEVDNLRREMERIREEQANAALTPALDGGFTEAPPSYFQA